MHDGHPSLVVGAALAGLPHGFFGRRGGVSKWPFDSLNCGPGSGDDVAAVNRNRQRVVDRLLPGGALVTVYQVHGTDVATVAGPVALDDRPHADAMVTDRPGLLLGVLTADCAPVLFADEAARVVGAAHAGWKGALGGVTDATIAAMEQRGARRDAIRAAIGPCIAQASYEVDDGFRARFAAEEPANTLFFVAGRAGHWQFDLEGYVAHRLVQAGVTMVHRCGTDTLADPGLWFSYRRSCLAGERERYGRQISVIGLASD